MIVDKISVISTKKVYRRAHDLVDLYNLIVTTEDIKLQDIFQISKDNNKGIGDFNEILNELDKVAHAYSKLRGISDKKNFEDVYKLLMTFLEPVIKKSNKNLKWSLSLHKWILLK